jgi:DNA-binding MarR family transcriptional regulator
MTPARKPTPRHPPGAAPHSAAAAPLDLGKLADYLGYQIRQAQSAIFRDLARATRPLGVTPGEFSLLATLQHNPGLSSMRLARAYRLDKTSLSLALKRLAGRGLIASNRNEGDRRYHALALTAAGRAVLRRATRRIEAQERAMDALLGPGERALLVDRLRRIAATFGR